MPAPPPPFSFVVASPPAGPPADHLCFFPPPVQYFSLLFTAVCCVSSSVVPGLVVPLPVTPSVRRPGRAGPASQKGSLTPLTHNGATTVCPRTSSPSLVHHLNENKLFFQLNTNRSLPPVPYTVSPTSFQMGSTFLTHLFFCFNFWQTFYFFLIFFLSPTVKVGLPHDFPPTLFFTHSF